MSSQDGPNIPVFDGKLVACFTPNRQEFESDVRITALHNSVGVSIFRYSSQQGLRIQLSLCDVQKTDLNHYSFNN